MEHLTEKEIVSINKSLGEGGITINNNLSGIVYGLRDEEDIVKYSSKLIDDLIMLHPFLEGNKRTAFFSFVMALRKNGYKINKYHEYTPKVSRIINSIIFGKAKKNEVERLISNMSVKEKMMV